MNSSQAEFFKSMSTKGRRNHSSKIHKVGNRWVKALRRTIASALADLFYALQGQYISG
ncbi:MAG: hypothetical protein LBU34_08385 [Planctomycetaceae bacterium]|nr:hypothetical protein [Planctomycetaceae bacterium]